MRQIVDGIIAPDKGCDRKNLIENSSGFDGKGGVLIEIQYPVSIGDPDRSVQRRNSSTTVLRRVDFPDPFLPIIPMRSPASPVDSDHETTGLSYPISRIGEQEHILRTFLGLRESSRYSRVLKISFSTHSILSSFFERDFACLVFWPAMFLRMKSSSFRLRSCRRSVGSEALLLPLHALLLIGREVTLEHKEFSLVELHDLLGAGIQEETVVARPTGMPCSGIRETQRAS
ncbi:MAG: hypothetical protein MZV49_04780 [Rhodopseudomonas palustris]|nr:hypothetical protein [Rhodopseudomonas palustris]